MNNLLPLLIGGFALWYFMKQKSDASAPPAASSSSSSSSNALIQTPSTGNALVSPTVPSGNALVPPASSTTTTGTGTAAPAVTTAPILQSLPPIITGTPIDAGSGVIAQSTSGDVTYIPAPLPTTTYIPTPVDPNQTVQSYVPPAYVAPAPAPTTTASPVVLATSGPASGLQVIAPPNGASAGYPTTITVNVVDDAGNLVSGYNGSATLYSNDLYATYPPSVAIVNGSGSFSMQFFSRGTKTIEATAGGLFARAYVPVMTGTMGLGRMSPALASRFRT